MRHAITATSSVVMVPRRNSTWNRGTVPDSDLIIASLKVKAAIDPIIRSAPVRLSERGMAGPGTGDAGAGDDAGASPVAIVARTNGATLATTPEYFGKDEKTSAPAGALSGRARRRARHGGPGWRP